MEQLVCINSVSMLWHHHFQQHKKIDQVTESENTTQSHLLHRYFYYVQKGRSGHSCFEFSSVIRLWFIGKFHFIITSNNDFDCICRATCLSKHVMTTLCKYTKEIDPTFSGTRTIDPCHWKFKYTDMSVTISTVLCTKKEAVVTNVLFLYKLHQPLS